MGVLSNIHSRISALMEGATVTSPAVRIPLNRFKIADYGIDSLLSASVSAPYPFTLGDPSWAQPTDVRSTLAASKRWHGATLQLRVAYAAQPQKRADRQRLIMDDLSAIRKTLDHPLSYQSITGHCRTVCEDAQIAVFSGAELEGGEGEQDDLLVLVVPLAITYEEDYTS